MRSAPLVRYQLSASPPQDPFPTSTARLQTALVEVERNPVALAGVMGLAAAAGIVSVVGIVAAMALNLETN